MSAFDDLWNDKQLTGRQVIEKLWSMQAGKNVYFALTTEDKHEPDKYPVNDFFSWRGSYCEPSIWSYGDTVYPCSYLIKKLEEFFDSIQTGWKGGEFAMDDNCRLWCDPEGSSMQRGVKAVIEDDCAIYIVVGQFEF